MIRIAGNVFKENLRSAGRTTILGLRIDTCMEIWSDEYVLYKLWQGRTRCTFFIFLMFLPRYSTEQHDWLKNYTLTPPTTHEIYIFRSRILHRILHRFFFRLLHFRTLLCMNVHKK